MNFEEYIKLNKVVDVDKSNNDFHKEKKIISRVVTDLCKYIPFPKVERLVLEVLELVRNETYKP